MVQGEGTAAPARRGRPRSEESHRAVLEATATLIEELPYPDITIEGIAAQAKVSKQTIYRWWPGKTEVVLETILSGILGPEIAPLPNTGDLRADISELLTGRAEVVYTENVVSMTRSVLSALVHSPNPEDSKRAYEVWNGTALADRLRAEQREGTIRSDVDVDAAAAALIDPYLIRIITSGQPDREWTESLVAIVIDGLLVRG